MKTILLEQRKNPLYNHGAATLAQKCYKAYNVPQLVYVVQQLVDSTSPAVGSELSKSDVDHFCNAKNWKVTIKGKK